jgi:hypothetical protein
MESSATDGSVSTVLVRSFLAWSLDRLERKYNSIPTTMIVKLTQIVVKLANRITKSTAEMVGIKAMAQPVVLKGTLKGRSTGDKRKKQSVSRVS